MWRAVCVTVFLAALAFQVRETCHRIGYTKVASLDFGPGHGSFDGTAPSQCSRVDLAAPVEDLSVFDGERGMLLGATGHVWECALLSVPGSWANRSHQNRLVLVDVQKKEVSALRVLRRHPASGDWSPVSTEDKVFHGVFYSKSSGRLYAVSHHSNYTAVEILQVREEAVPALAKEEPEPVEFHGSVFLEHLHTVRSSEFQRLALNDVVEAEEDGSSFFVTEWLDHGETKGKRANSLLENLASMAKFILKFKRTRLLRCAWNAGSWSCSAATSERFQMANGLATTPDRRFVFVSDPTALEVVVYRSQAGKLSRVTSFAPKHSVDNLEVVESRLSADEVVLHGGTVPTAFTSGVGCEMGLSTTWPIWDRHGRQGFIGCKRSPGSLLELRIKGLYASPERLELQMQDRLMHDGSLLSDVSCAIGLRGRVTVGSPSSPGLLFCDL